MKKFLCICSLLLSFLLILGCASFVGNDDEVLQISDIKSQLLDNGDILITISYLDESQKPTTFTVPKGKQGETGIGIKEVLTSEKNDGNTKVITIVYTDSLIQPTVVELNNGLSILNIQTVFDDVTNNTSMILEYSDGTVSEPIILPKGDNGKDGLGIVEIKQRVNRDFSVTLTIVMSNEEEVQVTIPAPQKGEDGLGIKDIVSVPNGDKYIMTITYTDDTVKELEFARPNKWFSEMSIPSSDDGINGDLWYDLAHNVIYVKQNNKWNKIIDLSITTSQTYTIRFELNDSNDEPASLPVGSLFTYEIVSGHYFKDSGYDIPIPTRNGYSFKGWYTVKVPTVVNGAFTDLTPVFSDLILFAIWEENN